MNAHGGNAGFHKKIFEDHLKTLIADEGKAALGEFLADEQRALTAKARASACEEFSSDKKVWKEKEEAWKENNAKMFNLVLLHCPCELEEVLKTLTKWDAARLGQDAILLLGLIRDVTHKHDETKQGTMALVELFLEFAATFQETGQTVDAYSTLF